MRETKPWIQLRNVLIISKETHEEQHNWNMKLLSVDNIKRVHITFITFQHETHFHNSSK